MANKKAETKELYPRDIGRSSEFSEGSVVVQFGDTFDEKGRFLMAEDDRMRREYPRLYNTLPGGEPLKSPYNLDNTCAIVVDKNQPAVTKYNRDERGKVHEFIDQIPREFPPNTTHKLWSFSGIVETSMDKRGIIHGYTWFRVYETENDNDWDPPDFRFVGSSGAIDRKYARMGVAKVEYDAWKRVIKTLRTEIEPTTLSNVSFPVPVLMTRPEKKVFNRRHSSNTLPSAIPAL